MADVELESLSVELDRPSSSEITLPKASSFVLGPKHQSYKHQFSNIYFLRLRFLRDAVERRAWARWGNVDGQYTVF